MYKLPFFLLANKLFLLSNDVLCEKKKKDLKSKQSNSPSNLANKMRHTSGSIDQIPEVIEGNRTTQHQKYEEHWLMKAAKT